ncbi:hypothetical protein ABZ468_07765 [Streptomyces sp. NPDC005708]|uniref:hypothetical protein n=1 Tax=Streptomyces sp. NPDC005708 TaxID=3154564 RepID=UPI0033C540F9
MITSSAAVARLKPVDEALMRLAYDQWIPMPDVARQVANDGLPSATLTTLVRHGRRNGVLRTRRTPEGTFVKRVREFAATPS